MISTLSHVTVLVNNQDEALAWYIEKLGFEKKADWIYGQNNSLRWLSVGPVGQKEVEIILQNPDPNLHGPEGAKQLETLIGKSPLFVFKTADCRQTCAELKAKGVTFVTEPMEEFWGVYALFIDLYGNVFNLFQEVYVQR
jgi:uncharacterized glyoxalase superfamily protein PhnB